jgi:hypothetical protein
MALYTATLRVQKINQTTLKVSLYDVPKDPKWKALLVGASPFGTTSREDHPDQVTQIRAFEGDTIVLLVYEQDNPHPGATARLMGSAMFEASAHGEENEGDLRFLQSYRILVRVEHFPSYKQLAIARNEIKPEGVDH